MCMLWSTIRIVLNACKSIYYIGMENIVNNKKVCEARRITTVKFKYLANKTKTKYDN